MWLALVAHFSVGQSCLRRLIRENVLDNLYNSYLHCYSFNAFELI